MPDPGATLDEVLARVRQRLAKSGQEDAALSARLIVEHFTGTTRAHALLSPKRGLSPEALAAIDAAIDRRIAGEPVYRILGTRDFYGLRLTVTPDTLDPRPDTETLVDAMVDHVKRIAAGRGGCRILDLGTGTGAVALALLSVEPAATAAGVDISERALAVATANASANGLADRFQPMLSDWFSAIEGRWDAIVSNPPYIASHDLAGLPTEVREHDPAIALDGGPDGLGAYRIIASRSPAFLEANGVVGVETGSSQREAVERIFSDAGFARVSSHRDLAGLDRAQVFCL